MTRRGDKEMETTTQAATTTHLFHDGLIPKFSGVDQTYSSDKWVEDVEENAVVFSWTPVQTLIIARRSLTGVAALWLKTERVFKTFDELKNAIVKEFPDSLNSKQAHELLATRRKNNDETYYEYMLHMKELGRRGKVTDYVTIQYIIDGIVDYENNKSILYGHTNFKDFKERLAIYETMKKNTIKMPRRTTPTPASTQKRGDERRCYKCGDRGHISSSCSKGIKCFKCGAFGHTAPACTNTTNTTERTGHGASGNRSFLTGNGDERRVLCAKLQREDCTARNVGSIEEETSSGSGERHVVLNVNKRSNLQKSMKTIEISGVCVESLIDTGSDLNLVSEELFFELSEGHFTKVELQLSGLGLAKVNALGKFCSKINIDGHCFETQFYIVPRDTMPFKMILGLPFLENVTVVFDKGSVSIVSRSDGEMLKCLITDVEPQPQCYVPNDDIRLAVQELVKSYKPIQVKEAPIEMKIILKDDIPIAQRPRRLSLHEQKIVDDQVEDWLQKGIVKPSFSEYASPLVLVKKKNGSTRVCVDYRKVNEKMVKDQFPLPVIDDHIDKLSGAKIFSKIDLKDAFFHLKISNECTKYTSFVTQSAQFEFLRAPFGMSICPNYFTRFINIIFREKIAKGYLLIFIDDLIISAETYEEALDRLREVMSVASEYGLLINWEKCDLLTTRVEYLGHIVENGTVRPSMDKVEAVMKFPELQTVKQVQSFIGLTSYFRKFIEGYSDIARPLTDLLKKDNKFKFEDEQRLAYELLKKKLSEQPVLRIFSPGLNTELHTDASQQAFAAILLQKDPNDQLLHPVYYMSKKTTDAEKKYTSYELEALAVVEGVKKFRRYLLGIPFKIVTDCLAFEMTLKKKDLTTRVARWVLLLQEYNYTIEHRSGTRMRHVDALSRNPYISLVTRGVHEQLKKAQQADEELQAIMEIIKEKPYLDFYEQNGLLYKGEEGRIVVPKVMDFEIIRRVHENGHFGRKKMTELLNKDYYIKNISRKIEEVIVSCIPCILAMRKEGKQEGFLNNIEKEEIPLSTIHCDHIGPLSETKKQYNYILTVVDAFTKFVWLFPTKSTTAKETIDKLKLHQQTFGNPYRIITDRGAAFTSNDFTDYCKTENISHSTIVTGIPRGNGQVERIHRILISVLTKMCIEDEKQWYKHISRVQRCINSTYQRSIGTSPYELLVGTKMKQKEDIELTNLLQEESKEIFTEKRDSMRTDAKLQILKVQEENRRSYNKRRKESKLYNVGDLVAIKRTQFGTCMKLKPKYLGPYKVVKSMGRDRYEVEKAEHATEGPWHTTSAADHMKRWPEVRD